MSERKTIYLCLAHMSEEGVEQKYVKEAFDTSVTGDSVTGDRYLSHFSLSQAPLGKSYIVSIR